MQLLAKTFLPRPGPALGIIAMILVSNVAFADDEIISPDDQFLYLPFYLHHEGILSDTTPCEMVFTPVDSHNMGNCTIWCYADPNYPDSGMQIVFDNQHDMPGTQISRDACEQELQSQTQYENNNHGLPDNRV